MWMFTRTQTIRGHLCFVGRIHLCTEAMMKIPFLLGRLAFGGFFLYSGINHFQHYKQMAQYAGSKGVPKPEAAVLGTGALLTLGGASVLLGAKPKLGTLAI